MKTSVLHALSLAKFVVAYTRAWAAGSPCPRVRDKARIDRNEAENALLREELRIKDARMAGNLSK